MFLFFFVVAIVAATATAAIKDASLKGKNSFSHVGFGSYEFARLSSYYLYLAIEDVLLSGHALRRTISHHLSPRVTTRAPLYAHFPLVLPVLRSTCLSTYLVHYVTSAPFNGKKRRRLDHHQSDRHLVGISFWGEVF